MTAVILTRVKYPHNLAAAVLACACFEVERLFYTGHRFQFADGERLPREERMRGYAAVKFEATERPFDAVLLAGAKAKLPIDVVPVCVELTRGAAPLTHFAHPEHAVYVFGPEDGHVPQSYRALCHRFLYIPAHHCLNLAAAVNVVLAHRMM